MTPIKARLFLLPILLFATLFAFGCGTPDAMSPDTANALAKAQGGNADSSATNKKNSIGTAASYLADATANVTSAEVSRTVSNSAAGDVQMAFNFAGVVNAQDALQKAIATDPVVQVLKAKIERLQSADPVNEAEVSQAAAELAQRLRDLQAGLAAAGGSLPNLTHLTVVNVKRSSTGADLQPINGDEAREVTEGLKAIKGTTGPGN